MASERKRLISWVPAIALSVIVVGIVVTSVVLASSDLVGPAPKPTEGQVSELNWSSFTDDGLAYIDRSREVRIDFSDKAEDAAELGLPADDELTIGPNSEGLDYSFTFKGGGAGRGGDKLYVSELTIVTEDGAITEVRAPISEILSFRQTLSALQQEAEAYG